MPDHKLEVQGCCHEPVVDVSGGDQSKKDTKAGGTNPDSPLSFEEKSQPSSCPSTINFCGVETIIHV